MASALPVAGAADPASVAEHVTVLLLLFVLVSILLYGVGNTNERSQCVVTELSVKSNHISLT